MIWPLRKAFDESVKGVYQAQSMDTLALVAKTQAIAITLDYMYDGRKRTFSTPDGMDEASKMGMKQYGIVLLSDLLLCYLHVLCVPLSSCG